jgi:hypothetical protein
MPVPVPVPVTLLVNCCEAWAEGCVADNALLLVPTAEEDRAGRVPQAAHVAAQGAAGAAVRVPGQEARHPPGTSLCSLALITSGVQWLTALFTSRVQA